MVAGEQYADHIDHYNILRTIEDDASQNNHIATIFTGSLENYLYRANYKCRRKNSGKIS